MGKKEPTVNEMRGALMQRKSQNGLYSGVDRALPLLKRNKGTYNEYLAELRSMPGVSKNELEARDNPTHALRGDPNEVLAPHQFARTLREAPFPRVTELRPGETHPDSDEEHEGFERYTLPGGENYREMLFQHRNPGAFGVKPFLTPNHFEDIPNILAHARLKDRTGPNGEKILHAEEIQSDWHQQARDTAREAAKRGQKGVTGYIDPKDAATLAQLKAMTFPVEDALRRAKTEVAYYEQRKDPVGLQRATEELMRVTPQAMKHRAQIQDLEYKMSQGVPDAPFKKDWHEMVLKHLIAHAAKNGYDMLAITPGQQQADRYKLSNHIHGIEYEQTDPGKFYVRAMNHQGMPAITEYQQTPEQLENLFGRDIAQKIVAGHGDAPDAQGNRYLHAPDLTVGGEGMKAFYDKMVPAALNKLGKRFGVQTGTVNVEQPRPGVTMPQVHDAILAEHPGFAQLPQMQQQALFNATAARMAREQPAPTVSLHAFPITPELREHVNEHGLPLFADGGDVNEPDGETENSKGGSIHNTPEFKRWFGKSKAVDEQGKPMTLYHGTVVRPHPGEPHDMGDIHAFDRMYTTKFRKPSLDTLGSWFSTNPGEQGARMYAGNGPGAAIYPTHLSIQSPHETTFPLLERRARLLANGKDDGRQLGTAEVEAYRKWLKAMGNDGIVIKHDPDNERGSTEFRHQDAWIALEPHQIKSAIGNRGTFDPNDPDITKARGGRVDTMAPRAARRRRS